MADTLFVDATTTVPGTPIVAAWMNDVDKNVYAVLSGVAGTNTITANTNLPVQASGYTRGLRFFFTPAGTNTGAVTINLSGLGPKNILKQGNIALTAGDIVSGSTCIIFYDGVQFQLINPQGPLDATDTYITTAGTTTAYTLPVAGNFSRFSGNAVKLIFNAANTSTTPTLDVDGTGAAAMKVMSASGTKIDPIVGAFGANIPATAIWDGTNWLIIPEYPSGRLLNTQVFTASGTYTPTPGTAKIQVEVQGAGGGGGSAQSTAGGNTSVGGGGGGGSRGLAIFTTGFTPTVAVTIGTGGTGSAANGVAGGTGTSTSFGALLVVAGSSGGASGPQTPQSFAAGGVGGAVSGTPLVSIPGMIGGSATSFVTANGVFVAGAGGPSHYGAGGIPALFSVGGAVAIPGGNATGFGGGGGGAGQGPSAAGLSTGGNGTGGLIIVYEYS